MECSSIEQVRENIDSIDREIVSLISEREHYVKQGARFKTDIEGVRAPERVAQVIDKVRSLAHLCGGNPDLVELVYRTMLREFINMEMEEFQRQ